LTRLLPTILVVLSVLLAAERARAAGNLEKQTGVTFPDAIAQFAREEVREFPDRKLGVAIRYLAPGLAKADIFIYDLGIKGIQTGAASRVVRTQFEQTLRDIFRLEERGAYAEVALLSKSEGPGLPQIGELRLLHARFSYAERSEAGTVGPKLISHAFLTGYRGAFLKIRVTCPVEVEAQAEKAIHQFFDGLRAILQL